MLNIIAAMVAVVIAVPLALLWAHGITKYPLDDDQEFP